LKALRLTPVPRIWLLLLVVFFCAGLTQAARRANVHALTHATVIVQPGTVLNDATVVLRDGLIESVKEAGPVPADAVEIDLTDHWIHAAFIDSSTRLALGGSAADESGGARSRSTTPTPATGAVHPLTRVRPETRARDGLRTIEAGDRQAERMRELGFATVLIAPDRGLFKGRSCLVSIAPGRPVSEIIVKDDVAQHVSLARGGFGGGYPASLMGAVAAIRQTLHDSQRHRLWSERYAAQPLGMQRPPSSNAFEALAPLLEGHHPLVIEASGPQDALLAHRTAAEFELPLLIVASGHEWEIAEQLAQSGRALLYPIAFPEKPSIKEPHEALDLSLRSMRRYLDAAEGPSILRDAGVSFALTTRGLKNLTEFKKNLEKIVEAGMSGDELLAALTTTPATLLGVDGILGTLEPGKVGSLVVSDGPPFAKETRIKRLFIDGIDHEFEQKPELEGDPNAVVDPRGEWSVSFDMGARSFERVWTIEGEKDDYRGSSESDRGTIEFESITLAGNLMTVVFPARGGRGSTELTAIIEGDSFEGSTEMGPRTVTVTGTRSSSPEDQR